MKLQPGRHFFGLGAMGYGVITLVWHQVHWFGVVSPPVILIYIVGIAELASGIAMQWDTTASYGAALFGAIFFILSLRWIPAIVKTPLVFGYWGNFFELFSIVLGGVFIFTPAVEGNRGITSKIASAAYVCFAICVVSFGLYQLFYLKYTAELVPKWIPPGQMFWAVGTTIAFALAAAGMFLGRSALLSMRLLTAMIILFGLLVWVQPSFADPANVSNWSELVETFAIAGVSWVVADFLSRPEAIPARWPLANIQHRRTGD